MGETVQSLVGQAGGGPGLIQLVLFMVPMLVVMYVLMIRPERKKQAEAQALLGSLKKGDEVALTSGILGKILSLDEKTITLEIADKTKIKVLKQAVMGPAARYLAVAEPKDKDQKKLDEKSTPPPSGNPTPVPDEKGDKGDKTDKTDKKSA